MYKLFLLSSVLLHIYTVRNLNADRLVDDIGGGGGVVPIVIRLYVRFQYVQSTNTVNT